MNDDVIWITKNGVHIPITNDYMNNYIKQKSKNIKDYNENEEQFKKNNQNILYENQNFTDEQKNAIKEWTSDTGYGGSSTINRFLNNKKELSPEAQKIVNEKIEILQSTINQPINEDIYVWYGTKVSPKDLQQGQILPNNGFTATSIYQYNAGVHSYNAGSLIKIKVNKGTKALYIGDKTSFSKNEYELLFGKGHSVKIDKIQKLYDKDGDFMNYEVEGELI
jgi:hypothetical protein